MRCPAGYFLMGVGAVCAASKAHYPVGSVYTEEHAEMRDAGLALGVLGLLLILSRS